MDGKFCPIFVQPHIPHPFGEEGDAAKARLGGLMGMTSVPGYLLSASPESIAAHNTTSMPKKWATLSTDERLPVPAASHEMDTEPLSLRRIQISTVSTAGAASRGGVAQLPLVAVLRRELAAGAAGGGGEGDGAGKVYNAS